MNYRLTRALVSPPLRYFYRVRAEGLEHVPATGGAILASNHRAPCDPIFLAFVLRRPLAIPSGDGQQALDQSREALEEGGLCCIYPEGTRSPDGRLRRGHTDVARLALQCRVPVVAVAMVGTADVQPAGGRPRLFMPVTVRLSRPLSFQRFADRAGDPRVLRRIADEVMFEVRELSGQEYVPRYADRP